MTHAIVLIEAERAAMPTLGATLADVAGVVESKVEIQIVRRASAQSTGQVVDSLGPYMLRC